MVNTLAALGHFGRFAFVAFARMLIPPWNIGEASRFTWQITSRCVIPVIATVAPLGMVMTLQGLVVFDLFGAQRLISSLVSVAVFRELSPVMASALVAAQGGSSFAAELGAMRIKEEIDATEVMAFDPIRVHVAPRLFASIVATPLLHLIGSIGGITGGYLVAVYGKGESGGIFLANMWNLVGTMDIAGGLIKTTIFGTIIGLIACYKGFYATGGAAGVGKAVNDTVVLAITTFIIANYFLTSAFYGTTG